MDYPPPYEIAISFRAGRDMREIRRYLRQNASDKIAEKIVAGWFEAMETLREQPERYPPEPLLAAHGNFRVIRKGSYKIFYEFTGFDIYIHRIIHAKRDFGRIFRDFKP